MTTGDPNSLTSLREGEYVYVRTAVDGSYISALPDDNLEFKKQPGEREKFQLIRKGKGKWAFRSVNNQYLSAVSKDVVLFASRTPLRAEEFLLIGRTLDQVKFYSKFHAYYMNIAEDGKLRCNFSPGHDQREDGHAGIVFRIERVQG